MSTDTGLPDWVGLVWRTPDGGLRTLEMGGVDLSSWVVSVTMEPVEQPPVDGHRVFLPGETAIVDIRVTGSARVGRGFTGPAIADLGGGGAEVEARRDRV